MPPIAVPPRLFERALREALDGAMAPERVTFVIASALERARLAEVPEEFGAFQTFVQGALAATLATVAGPAATETCVERLSHVLWMASSTIRSRVPSPAELAVVLDGRADRDDASGLRMVEAPPVPRRSPTLGRIAVTQTRAPGSGGVVEVSAKRTPASCPVLVIGLDASLARDLGGELGPERTVVPIGSSAELVRQITALRAKGFAVLVDAALPSVDLPTFAGFWSMLPPGTRVVLWGADERQKRRLVGVFPQASDWVASNGAATPGALFLG